MKRLIVLISVLTISIFNGFSAGLIIVHEPDFWHRPPIIPPIPPPRPPLPPPRPVVWAPLEVNLVKINTTIDDQYATTSVEQEFYNPNPSRLEGTFILPIPKGAVINKFSMEIDGKKVEAELLDAKKARDIYQEIVRKLRDPALLEFAEEGLFKVRIFPIEPHSKKRIALSYSQLLKSDSGLINFVLPLRAGRYSAALIKNISVKIDLKSSLPLKSIYSPSHKVEIKREGEKRATIGFEESNVKPESDFQLFFSQQEGEFGLKLLTYKESGEDGYFLMLVTPSLNIKERDVLPKDVVFVLDSSGSMAGAKLEQAKKALKFCVANLDEKDRFEIIRFSTDLDRLFSGLQIATKENRERAEKFITEIKSTGGTAIDDALRAAISLASDDQSRLFVIVFLTDGIPTVGVTDEEQILNNVSKNNKLNTRIFCFGIGTDVNTHLLDKITSQTRASSQYILPDEDIEVKVSSFFSKIKEPVLANLKVTFPEQVKVSRFYPSPLPDIFKGDQLVIVGRYANSGKSQVRIEGNIGKEKRVITYDCRFADTATDCDFLPRLWAVRRIGFLLDEIRLNGENKELKDEITELSRKYGIVTPYTAFLIMEDESRRDVALDKRLFRFSKEDEALARRDLGAYYDDLTRSKSGMSAVAGARSYQSLKLAESPSIALEAGMADAMRAAKPSARSVQERIISAPQTPDGASPNVSTTGRIRYAAGKTFYFSSGKWMDADIQKSENLQPIKIKFLSDDYFALVSKRPIVAKWLGLGVNIEFVLDNKIYEITE
jgi:Ca-activated chloride channel family protein